MPLPMPHVFVYGPDSLQARIYDRLGPSEVLGGATAAGWALKFNKPSFKSDDGLANLAKEPSDSVFGVLYELTRKQIEMLDGYYGGYQREDLQVTPLSGGSPVNASAWVARRTKSSLRPSKESLALTKKGAEENGAPQAFLDMLSKMEASNG
jgi:hypothetical protein